MSAHWQKYIKNLDNKKQEVVKFATRYANLTSCALV